MITAEQLAQNWGEINERIAVACARAGRDREPVKLLPVSKTHPPETIAALMGMGVTDFGEARVQEIRRRDEWFAARGMAPPRWHMIGTLQRNKVRQLLDAGVALIHSVDSADLLLEIERHAALRRREVQCLLEVNVSGEASKHGFVADAVGQEIGKALPCLTHARVRGLMTMAPLDSDAEAARPVFRRLHELSGRLQREWGLALPVLSMGMTNDYETAVEEGATIVRIGTALFGARDEDPDD